MTKFLAVLVGCLMFLSLSDTVNAKGNKSKGPTGPYKKYQAAIIKYEAAIAKENERKSPNEKSIARNEAKIMKYKEDMTELHEKNKAKYLDKKLAPYKKKLDAANVKGSETSRIDKKIAEITEAFEEKYGKYFDLKEEKPKKPKKDADEE